MSAYSDFLTRKRISVAESGFDFKAPDFLYPFQRVMTERALKCGRFAMFADCGLGKTPMQLVWADAIVRETNNPVLILAPLAVSEQTQREGTKFGINVTLCRNQDHIRHGVNITNYEMLEHFTPDGLAGLVLDESSILKNYGGVYRKEITAFAEEIPYRLACTATPAPNDLAEIINHAEFLGVMRGKEVIALFFRQDGNTTHAWRLKGHARSEFWRWLASWAVAVRMPSDLGFDNGPFILPELTVKQYTVDGHISDGFLFPIEAQSLQERQQARRESMDNRVGLCAELANTDNSPWLIWCGLNAESQALADAIPDAIQVSGSDSQEHKTDALLGFQDGRYRVLVTKPSIAGFGMNFQHCHNVAFVGLSDSWEQYYQAIRRCWRFGQQHPVTAHVIVADTEGAVKANIERKEHDAAVMMEELVKHMGQQYRHHKDDGRYNGIERMQIPAFLGRAHESN